MTALKRLQEKLFVLGCPCLDQIMPALEIACREENAKLIVDCLAKNLTQEHVAKSSASGGLYELSTQEQEVASAFTASLNEPQLVQTASLEEKHQQQQTIEVLSEATKELITKAEEEIRWAEKDMQKAKEQYEAISKEYPASLQIGQDASAAVLEVLEEVEARHESPDLVKLHLSLQTLEEFEKQDNLYIQKELATLGAALNSDLKQGSAAGSLELGGKASNVAIQSEIERLRGSTTDDLYNEELTEASIASSEATIASLHDILRKPEMALLGKAMEAEIERKKARLDFVSDEVDNLTVNELPRLCKEIGGKLGLDIIQVKYDEELWRNKYFNGIKEQALQQLVERAADIGLLLECAKREGAYFAELRQHIQLLVRHGEELRDRLKTSTSLMSKDADKSTFELQQFSPSFRRPTKAELQRKEQLVQDGLAAMEGGIIHDLQEECGRMHSLAFADASYELPAHSSADVTAQRNRLQESTEKLDKTIKDIRKMQNSYNDKIMAQPLEMDVGKITFQTFFSHPKDLKQLGSKDTTTAGEKAPSTTGGRSPAGILPRGTTAKKTLRPQSKQYTMTASSASHEFETPRRPKFQA